MTFIYTFLILSGFWVLLSGKFDAFHLSLGFICCLLVSYLSHDLLFDRAKRGRNCSIPVRFFFYLPWLILEIVRANFHVARLALSPRLKEEIDPKIVTFKTRLKSELARVTLANSITLTPGTITVKVLGDEFHVHAISRKTAEGLPGGMEKRIAKVFGEEIE